MILRDVEHGEISVQPDALILAERTHIPDGQVREVTKIYINIANTVQVRYVEESVDVIEQLRGS